MRSKLIKLAFLHPQARKDIFNLLKKAGEGDIDLRRRDEPAPKSKGRLSGKFLEFLKEEGDQTVSNPNPKSRDRFPQVKITSLSSSKEGKELVKKLFKEWLKKNEDKPKAPTPDKAKKDEGKSKENSKLKELPPLKAKEKVKIKPYFGIKAKDIDSYLKENKELFENAALSISEIYDEGDYEDKYNQDTGTIEGVDIPIEEKKMALTAHHVGRLVRGLLLEKHGHVYNRMIGEQGWVHSSMFHQTAVLQGVLSDLGVQGHFARQDGDAERDLYTKGKEDPDYVYSRWGEDYSKEAMKEMIKDTYIATQAYFKANGIKEVTLFRGVKRQIDGEPPEIGDEVSIKSRELSSWSTDPNVGTNFGRVVMAKVPVEQILSGYMTDPIYGGKSAHNSAYKESELLVLESSGIQAVVLTDK